ncbi:MAG: thioredoxin [Chloroflexi bacterium]|nr:MAG: thioredoxin [Chloroflexota bacterium]
MIERLVIAVGVAVMFGLMRVAFGAYAGFRMRDIANALDAGLLAELGIAGQPAVVYFWTETCGQCKVMQAPVLDRLAQTMPLQVVSVNAVRQPDLADRFGVMTVPTTAVIDGAGHVRAVNHGYADEQTLREQLAG